MPVSSEWMSDTERFLHFHVLQGSVSTVPGLGTVCRNLWRILKITEQHKTYRAGCFWTSFSLVSILHTLYSASLLFSDSESLLCCFLADLNFLCPFQKNPHELHSNSWTRPCLFFLLVTDDSRPYTSINTLYLFSTFLPLPPRAGACHRCGICHSTCLLNTDWLMMNGSVGELQPGMTTVSLSLQLFVSISLYSTMQQNAPCM